jgi:hypothetical protein
VCPERFVERRDKQHPNDDDVVAFNMRSLACSSSCGWRRLLPIHERGDDPHDDVRNNAQ